MKTLFVSIFVITFSINSQDFYNSNPTLADNFSNLPFYFGMELGSSLRLKDREDYTKVGLSAFININLYKRLLLLKVEIGNFDLHRFQYEGTQEEYIRSIWFLSTGLNYRVLKIDRTRLNLGGSVQLFGYGKHSYPVIAAYAGADAVVPISSFFGFMGGVKFNFANSLNPYLTIGFQIGNLSK